MHPAINREASAARVADMYRSAERDTIALAARRAVRARRVPRQRVLPHRVAVRLARSLRAVLAVRAQRGVVSFTGEQQERARSRL